MRGVFIASLFLIGAPAFFAYGLIEQRLNADAAATVEERTLAERRTRRIAAFAEVWPSEPDYGDRFSALTPAAVVLRVDDRPAFNPSDDYWGLPDAPGRDYVSGFCAGCHSLQIVMQQRATRERWVYMLDWMQKKQNMPALLPDDKRMVLDYLVAHFGTEH
ncbi:MAG: hypothetical protein AAF224_01660 [Pseudomonadota bacterium]